MKGNSYIFNIALLVLLSVLSSSAQENIKLPPNFIVILVDDLGIGDLQAYRKLYAENTEVIAPAPTPNLDKLACQGVVCTRAYATAWCAPSRQSLLSGMFTNRMSAYNQSWIGNLLRKEGYKTCFIGKSHGAVATQKTVDCIDNNNAEFDEWYGFTTGMRTYYVTENEPKNIQLTRRQGLVKPDVTNDKEGYLTDIFTREAVNFINRNIENPFMLYLAYNAPHTPLDGKPDDMRTLFPDKYASMTDEEIKATAVLARPTADQLIPAEEHFKALMFAVDRGIGEIFQTLKEKGLDKNTDIYFISDNGSKRGTNYPLAGIKHDVLEGGIRVPYIVWSEEIANSKMAGKYYDGLVSVCDVLPTCYSLATGQDAVDSDGANIMPYLLGEKEKLTNRIYYYAGAQRHWFGTKSKDKYPVKDKTEKVSVIRAFVYDECKRIHFQAHKTTEPRDLYFHLKDAVGKTNPSKILHESYDFDNNRVANASESQKKSVAENYNRFYRENKTDLTEEWSGEYLNPKDFK
jgi:arylsulfatase A-like enzyme